MSIKDLDFIDNIPVTNNPQQASIAELNSELDNINNSLGLGSEVLAALSAEIEDRGISTAGLDPVQDLEFDDLEADQELDFDNDL